jgi:DnaK suppressor protein
MDEERARALLGEERALVERLLRETEASAAEDRAWVDGTPDSGDSAQQLTAEGADVAVVAGLHERLEAIERAEQRLEAGTYGRSVRSGLPIPDDRLEAEPTAELTVEEAQEG